MQNAAPKYVLLLLGAVMLAGCGGGGGGSTQLTSGSDTTPSTLFTSGTSSIITLGAASAEPIPLPNYSSNNSGDQSPVDLNPSAVPEPNDAITVLAACGIVSALVIRRKRSKA